MIRRPGFLFALLALVGAQVAQGQEINLIPEVAAFVEKGTKAIAVEKADLDGDRDEDLVLVLEKEKPQIVDDSPVKQRPLLILRRTADGKLELAKRNDLLVMCSQCGGVFGDPFESIEVGRNTFTVHHYGGSNWRWKVSYKFKYSRIDKTWQLVRVENTSYHKSDPDKVERDIHTPPKHFGKVDIADFDPENYLKKSLKRN
ncbi:MAG TPA: hypothetical protein VNA17_04450 [Pyrinomonadaceae bacterium]|nr:hypothetical protein [Pyrinomonadaceae bacterium]